MGLVWGEVVLSNPLRVDLAPLPVRAIADSGAVYQCILEHVALLLPVQSIAVNPASPNIPLSQARQSCGIRELSDWGAGCFPGPLQDWPIFGPF